MACCHRQRLVCRYVFLESGVSGFGSCTGLSKMVLLYWVGDTLGRAMMIILTVMEISISDSRIVFRHRKII
ncbi:dxs [Gossypium arboreum]|uniref:Dxs n=1 Tax=Gossypium arboreum TaxID=29729 RepID=A0A0B0MKI3_GOSAR|nr:dxs [Gossypium arboreum]